MKIYYTFFVIILIYLYLSNYNIINEPFDETKSVVNIYDNVNKDMFEKIINNKSPTIFQNIHNKLNSQYAELKLQDKIKHIFNPYIILYSIKDNYNIHNESINSQTPIIRQTHYRYLFLLLSGSKKIILFSPNQVSNLYSNNDISPVNFWDSDPDKFPKFENVKYIELDLEPNEMLFIPYNWWYTMYSTIDSIAVSSNSESLSSYFLKFK